MIHKYWVNFAAKIGEEEAMSGQTEVVRNRPIVGISDVQDIGQSIIKGILQMKKLPETTAVNLNVITWVKFELDPIGVILPGMTPQ